MPLQLDRAAPVPLQDQLCEQLRRLILTGRLKPNTRIIATRFLAEQVGVSRRTVLFAYEQLIAEGYLETRPAIGTFVSPTPPAHLRPEIADRFATAAARQPLFRNDAASGADACGHLIDFSPSQFDSGELLPPKVWLRAIREVVASDPEILSRPVPAAGVEPLRRVIADYLAATRGILVSPDQIVIVAGRRHACSLVAQLFRHRDARVVIEAPGDGNVARIFEAHGADVIGVPVDELGLQTDRLPHLAASLAFVTPARQNPTGAVMPHARRAALMEWAQSAGGQIVEDDSDADLRYVGSAQPPLIALDPDGRTFHIGSFANRLGAGVCLGYLIAPIEFAEEIVAIKSTAMEGGQLLEQIVAANLLASGDYDHHLRRLRKTYLERRDALIHALRTHFGPVRLIGAESGTQLTWLLPDGAPSAEALRDAALELGVNIASVSGDDARECPFHDRALIFGYSALAPDAVRRGVAILADVYGRLSTPASGKYCTT